MKRVPQQFSRAAKRYEQSAVLQREILDALLERLAVMRITPARILDLGAGTGWSLPCLQAAYPEAELMVLDLAKDLLAQGKIQYGAVVPSAQWLVGDMENLPLASQSVDLVFSNLALQWARDTEHLLREVARVLRPGGLFFFSTLGPDTLKELRQAWHAVDPKGLHVNTFIDMHELGDALMGTGFIEPVMEMERWDLMYNSVQALIKDLRAIGANSVQRAEVSRYLGKTIWQKLNAAYPTTQEGWYRASFEAVFGHAWRKQSQSTETYIPIEGIQRHRPHF